MRAVRIVIFNIIWFLFVLGACARSVPDQTPGLNEVWIINWEFVPNVISVPVGTMVTWTNNDKLEHTVTSDNGLFNGRLSPGESYSYNFTEAGIFYYYDDLDVSHFEMKSYVSVK